MKQDVVEKWIAALGGTTKEGESILKNECTILLRLGEEIVSIVKVTKITFFEDYLELKSETERTFAPRAAIEALKITDEDASDDARAGFH